MNYSETFGVYFGDLAQGDRLATPEEVAAWELSRLPTPAEQIVAIEAANPITHRNLRDLSMTVAQIAAAVTGTDPMVNPAVQKIVSLEAEIAALRAQL